MAACIARCSHRPVERASELTRAGGGAKTRARQRLSISRKRDDARKPDRRPWDGDDRADLHARKKRLILETAARAFADRGYHGTTLESIATALRISKPTVYYYVKSKEEILFEIAKTALDDLERELATRVDADRPAAARLHHFFRAYAKMISGDLGVCMVLVADRSLRPASRRKLRAYKKQIESRAVALLEECIRDDRRQAEELRLLAYALFGAFNGIPQWFSPKGAISLEEVTRYYLRALASPFLALAGEEDVTYNR